MKFQDKPRGYCPVCDGRRPIEVTKGKSVSGREQWALSCRIHGRVTLWMATRELAEAAPWITPQRAAASKHLEPAGLPLKAKIVKVRLK